MKQWYLLAYDVKDPRRVQKIHYFLSKQALALQNSVFLVQETNSGLNSLLDEVKKRVDKRVDDVRLYPVTHPSSIWAAGKQSEAMTSLFDSTPKKAQNHSSKGIFRTLLEKVTGVVPSTKVAKVDRDNNSLTQQKIFKNSDKKGIKNDTGDR